MLIRCLGCMKQFEDDTARCPHCGYVVGTPAKEAFHLAPGTMLKKQYQVVAVIGYGGFGVIYI